MGDYPNALEESKEKKIIYNIPLAKMRGFV